MEFRQLQAPTSIHVTEETFAALGREERYENYLRAICRAAGINLFPSEQTRRLMISATQRAIEAEIALRIPEKRAARRLGGAGHNADLGWNACIDAIKAKGEL